MSTNTGTIMTIANSIIGVSVLAMPFCFKECGIVLSIIMLILSSILSRLTCYLLLKSAVLARRRNFEHLAFYIFGPTGKFIAELSIIGFLMGTCIAFFVVVGDLGPAIISKTLDINNYPALRPSVLIGLAVIVVLPLGLLRNVDSLSTICTATIGFYLCLVLKVVFSALPNLMSGVWIDRVHFWRPAGVLQCLPIFSMALFCQTQLFEIYESLPNASFERMNGAVHAAINLCTGVYISVGFFGYVTFFSQNFGGNILMSFAPSLMSELMKVGFVLSVAVSFPLVIFPCRASLYSLLFKRLQTGHYHDPLGTFIPEVRFKCITIFIIGLSLLLGLLIPNIELVLGLVGSTIGVGICVMFPALAFIFLSTKETADRVMAQFLLFVGIMILVLGTYATLYAAKEDLKASHGESEALSVTPFVPPHAEVELPPKSPEKMELVPPAVVEVKEDVVARKEPPVPVDPIVDKIVLVAEKPDKEVAPKISSEVIHKDALKKEDEELADAEKQADKQADKVKDEKTKQLFEKLEKHEEEQKKLLQEQKEIIQELKEQNKEEKKEDKHVKDLEKVMSQVLQAQEEDVKKMEGLVEASKIVGQPIVYQQRFKANETKGKTEVIKPEPKLTIQSIVMPKKAPSKAILAEIDKKVNEVEKVVEVDKKVDKVVEVDNQVVKVDAVEMTTADLLRGDKVVAEESKALRRDILEAGVLAREKRDAEQDCANTEATREALIKISERLADPVLAPETGADLVVNAVVTNEVKPMKRDLKSVDNRSKTSPRPKVKEN